MVASDRDEDGDREKEFDKEGVAVGGGVTETVSEGDMLNELRLMDADMLPDAVALGVGLDSVKRDRLNEKL